MTSIRLGHPVIAGLVLFLLLAGAGVAGYRFWVSKGYVLSLSRGYDANFTVRPAILPGGHRIVVERPGEGQPVITRAMFAERGVAAEGENINGPSVVALPDWLPRDRRADPAANYYMYFARHGRDPVSNYIRLAWAEDPLGPWHLFRTGQDVPIGARGVLDLGEDGKVPLDGDLSLELELGAPDVKIDHDNRRFVMYFHSLHVDAGGTGGSSAFVATSGDGLDFNGSQSDRGDRHGIRATRLGRPYFRTFETGGRSYAFSNFGFLYRAPDTGTPGFSEELWRAPWDVIDGPIRKIHDGTRDGDGDPPETIRNPRHFAIGQLGDRVVVLFTRRDDAPERVVASVLSRTEEDWNAWQASFPPLTLLEPELPWEGARRPIKPSVHGTATEERSLRDPCVFVDADGHWYLYYTGGGEQAIGVVRLKIIPPGTGQ